MITIPAHALVADGWHDVVVELYLDDLGMVIWITHEDGQQVTLTAIDVNLEHVDGLGALLRDRPARSRSAWME